MQRLQLAVWPDEPEDWQLIDTNPNKTEKQRAFDILKALAEMDFFSMGQSKANMTHSLTSVLMARGRKSLING